MKRLEHSLSMKGSSWHTRWYRYWVKLGGEPPEYKENLCHYMRVLLFWAPQRWFWQGKIKGVIAPWAVTLIALIVALLSTTAVVATGPFLEGLVIFGVIAVVIAVVLAVAAWTDKSDENEEKAKKIAFWVTSPLWIFPYAFFCAGERLWETMDDGVEALVDWFFKRYYLVPGLAPATVCSIAALIAFGVFATPVFLKIAAGIGIFLAIVVGCCVVVLGPFIAIAILDDAGKLDGIKSGVPKLFKSAINGTTDTVKLGYTYAMNKKEGSVICPFIEFEKPEPNHS